MMRFWMGLLCAVPLLLAAPVAADEGFKPLFDGETLDGWTGDPKLWSVENGEILGSTVGNPLRGNSFLATEEKYDNFVLRLKFKLGNHNSGVQVRSQLHDNWKVTGYQADIADKRYTGILYEEGGRGILADVDQAKVNEHFDREGWNTYEIICDGPKITQKLNGFTTIEYTEKDENRPKEGVIAFQLHTGPEMKIWFKDIELKPLP